MGRRRNFVPGATVALSTGDVIKGATNPVGYQTGGGGSLSSATCWPARLATTPSPATARRCLTTSSREAVLTTSHWRSATPVRITSASTRPPETLTLVVLTLLALRRRLSLRTSGVNEFVNPGWWGIAAGGSSNLISVVAGNGVGTSLDQSTLTNFNPGLDFLDFSVKAWADPAGNPLVKGLSADNGAAVGGLVNAAVAATATGAAANAALVGNGGTFKGTGAAPTDLIVLTEGSFLNAQSVATALDTGTYVVNHSKSTGGVNYDFLLAYQGQDGFAHLADLHITGGGGVGQPVRLLILTSPSPILSR